MLQFIAILDWIQSPVTFSCFITRNLIAITLWPQHVTHTYTQMKFGVDQYAFTRAPTYFFRFDRINQVAEWLEAICIHPYHSNLLQGLL